MADSGIPSDEFVIGDGPIAKDEFVIGNGTSGVSKGTESFVIGGPEAPKPKAFAETQRPKVDEAEPELTWAQVGKGALEQAIPSTKKVFTDIGEAITNPKETFEGIKQIGGGLYSKAKGAIGVEQDPEQKAKDESIVDAIGAEYAKRYGSMKGFKQAFAKDPASVLMDLSLPLTLIPSGGAAAGVSATSTLGKTLGAVGQAGRLLNPVDDALRLAGVVAKAPIALGRMSASVSSNVPYSLQKIASAAGSTGDKNLRAAYLRHASGSGDAQEIFSTAQKAFNDAKDAASAKFVADKANQAAASKAPSFVPIDDAITAARKELSIGGARDPIAFKQANSVLDDIEQLVQNTKANPNAHNFVDFDKLKRAIYDVDGVSQNSIAKSAMMKVYDGVKTSITDVSPEYAKLMEQWQTALSKMRDLQSGLGVGSRGTATSSLTRMLKSTKTKNGGDLISQLSTYAPELPFMLAGSAVRPFFTEGLGSQIKAFGGAGAIMSGALGYQHIPLMLAAASPKVTGALNYYPARLASAASKVKAPAIYGSYAGSIAGSENADAPAPAPGKQSDSQAPDLYNLMQRMAQVESGNRQFDKEGRTVTSPKNAVGVMQVTDAAHQDVAKKLGVPFDPQRLRTDEKYNRLIGETYFKMMVDRFKSPELAVAAYNGGPTRVEYALEQSKKRGGQWLDYMYPETQDYYRKVFGKTASASGGRIQRASGGRAGMNHVTRAAMLIRAAERAKNQHGDNTESLLNQPDESIAKALKVANSAI